MEVLWFYLRDGQQYGPFPFPELKRLASVGDVRPTDQVRPENVAEWVSAETQADLFPSASSAAVQPLPLDEPLELTPIVDDEPIGKSKESPNRQDSPRRGDETDDERGRRRRDDDDDRDRDSRRTRRREGHDDEDDDDYDRPRRRRSEDDPLEAVKRHFRRANAIDLQSIEPTKDEQRVLNQVGIEGEAPERFAVWRRSILIIALVPCFLAAIIYMVHAIDDGASAEKTNLYGPLLVLLIVLDVASRFALPVLMLIAALKFQRIGRSFRLLFLGFTITFFTPILIALVPSSWYVNLPSGAGEAQARMVFGFVLGFALFVNIVPSVLALIPGIIRASVRMKNLLPESVAPGWALLGSAPLNVLLSLAMFVLIYHVASNLLLVFGAFLFLGAPMFYLWRYDLFIRPLTRATELKSLAQMRLYAIIAGWAGFAFILIYMLATKIGGSYILGFDKHDLLRPWSLRIHAFWIDYLGKSLATTVLFADMLMRANVKLWREEKAFALTPHAADYAKTIEAIEGSIERSEERETHTDDDGRDNRRRRRSDREESDDRSDLGDRSRDDDDDGRRSSSKRDDRW